MSRRRSFAGLDSIGWLCVVMVTLMVAATWVPIEAAAGGLSSWWLVPVGMVCSVALFVATGRLSTRLLRRRWRREDPRGGEEG